MSKGEEYPEGQWHRRKAGNAWFYLLPDGVWWLEVQQIRGAWWAFKMRKDMDGAPDCLAGGDAESLKRKAQDRWAT